MNATIKDSSHPTIVYYDSDYPSKVFSSYPENFDPIVIDQGIADDVEQYLKLALKSGRKVLELCCGTGRVAIPLVMNGCTVTAVDVSTGLLRRFNRNIDKIVDFPGERLTIIRQDVTRLSLEETGFDVGICAFNSLLCIPDFHLQQQTLINASTYIRKDGLLALDIRNPWSVNLLGNETPEYFFSRRRADNGNPYSRFAATSPMRNDQTQTVYGWYDETSANGDINRSDYSIEWRFIFRYELELMLEKAGFAIQNIYGGNNNEPFQVDSPKMFVEAVRL